MADPTPDDTPSSEPPADPPSDPSASGGDDANGTGGDPEGADALGDPGKKALDTVRGERNAARKEARELKARIAELEAAARPPSDEPDIDKVRAEALAEASAKANARILSAEVRAAAAGKLADPADAARFLDLTAFEVGDDGTVDAGEIAEAIDDLLKSKPYLAAGAKPKPGNADQGARPSKPGQLTRDDLKTMSPQEIVKAKADGRLRDLLGGSTRT